MKTSSTPFKFFKWFLFMSVLCFNQTAIAQDLIRQYRTKEYIQFIRENYPGASAEQEMLERDHSRNYFEDEIKPVILPLVFHVLYNTESEKVPYHRILQQIDDLNRDFSLRETIQNHINDPDNHYSKTAINTSIQFCLASETPDRKITTGVNFIPVSTPVFQGFTDMKVRQSGTEPWDTERYINVWICHLPDDNAGFTQMPFGPRELDGIVIDYRYVSNPDFAPFNEGKTLTHLMGNYLNLYPLWGYKQCGDDHVEDTPIHNDINYGCPEDNHITACIGNAMEMTMNFMDNTDDACTYMFTTGQMIRMQNTILTKGVRHSLTLTPVQCNTGYEDWVIENRDADSGMENLKKFDAEIFPVPLSNRMNILLKGFDNTVPTQVFVLNAAGKTVLSLEIPPGSSSHVKSIETLAPGWYVAKLTNGNSIISRPIVIVKS